MVSTPVIVVVVVLAAALLTTSALLVYKLRPGRNSYPRKLSDADSEPVSPVRRLTVMRGRVVSTPSSPRRSLFQGWRASRYASRRASIDSFPNLRVDDDLKSPRTVITPSQLEAQTFESNTKSLYAISERELLSENSKNTKGDTNEKRGSARSLGQSRVIEVAETQGMEMSRALSKDDQPEDKGRPTPPKSQSSKPLVDALVVKAASVSAKPISAYSANPTPSSSIKSSVKKGAPSKESSSARKNDNLEPLPALQSAEAPRDDAKGLIEEKGRLATERDSMRSRQTTQDAIKVSAASVPVSQYSTLWDRLPRPSVRSRSRSRSASRSTKERSRSRTQRSRKPRPPPLAVLPREKHSSITAIHSTDGTQRPASSAYSVATEPAEVTADSSMEDPSPPPFLSATITNVMASPPFSHTSPSKNRQSVNTLATTDLSPTYSLASVRRVPLFHSKQILSTRERKFSDTSRNVMALGGLLARKAVPSLPKPSHQAALSSTLPSIPSAHHSNQSSISSSVRNKATSHTKISTEPPQELSIVSEAQDHSPTVQRTSASRFPSTRPSATKLSPAETIAAAIAATGHYSLPSPSSRPPSDSSLDTDPSSPRNRIISIPTGRRRSSRYSHLFETKALPKLPPTILPPIPDTNTSSSSSGSGNASDSEPPPAVAAAAALRSAQQPDISPMNTPPKPNPRRRARERMSTPANASSMTKRHGLVKFDIDDHRDLLSGAAAVSGVDDVSPLSVEFPSEVHGPAAAAAAVPKHKPAPVRPSLRSVWTS